MRTLLGCAFLTMSMGMQAETWDFSSVSSTDRANLDADPASWTYESSNDRWKNQTVFTASPLKANGVELQFAKGLLVTVTGADNVRIDNKKGSLTLNKAAAVITIPGLKAGDVVTIDAGSSNSKTARKLEPTNLDITSGFTESASRQTNSGKVIADGDVTFKATGGFYVYSITAGDNTQGPGTGDTPSADHSVAMNPMANQMTLTTTANDVKYYNTADLAEVSIDKVEGVVTVTPKAGDWNDSFARTVKAINFTKAPATGSEGDITNRGVNITESKGWLQSLYAKWDIMPGATSYNVYIKGGRFADYTRVDSELIRDYGTYGRVDIPGLAQGVYAIRVVPVSSGAEDASSASDVTDITVKPFDRSGFAFHNFSGVGAYKDNGELKDEARVLYVTAATAKTCKLNVRQKSNDTTGTEFTGLQAIITAYQKGYETRPLDVRIIGTIRDTDMDKLGSSAEGLQIKGKNNTSPMNITVEGIGDDAAIWGFGILVRACNSVELSNFAVMLCMDDCISLDTDNYHCWIHHLDVFYGKTGGANDQAKGDGAIDVKTNSQYITIAYNHFWDTGKSSLCGMTSEKGPNYIDYHHNWFDHSDSRHPRVRTMTVHVWNNYYDGVAKYGVGATMGSSVFVERNFYRHTKDPMLISRQGTDAKGDGTFSKENGGMIKSFGNLYAEKGSSSNYTVITQMQSPTSFDCFQADTRDERVPDTYKCLVGGTTYNNFDTDPDLMYPYTPVEAIDVPAAVTGYYGAGRLNKGDFRFDLNYSGADTDYSVNKELKAALQDYKSSLKGFF